MSLVSCAQIVFNVQNTQKQARNLETFLLLKIKKTLDFYKAMCYNNQVARETSRQYLGVAQLVARYLGVVEAASSSLVTQTKKV